MSNKSKIRIYFFLGALISGVLFSGTNIYLHFIQSYVETSSLSFIPQFFFTSFVLFTFAYYRYVITKADSLNFTDLLWKVFITGLITTFISLGIRLFLNFFSESSIVENPVTISFFYSILVALVTVYMVSTFVVWKRLILYQKSKKLIWLWDFFEIVLLLALVYDLVDFYIFSTYSIMGIAILSCFSMILVLNLKWVAYLNFKQKWKGILFIFLSAIYLYHFSQNLDYFRNNKMLAMDLLDRVFIIGLFVFLFLYAVISILVTLFNLPTSSVFEQKLKEAIGFRKLSQSIPRGETINQTYKILLESSMSVVFADAAWMEAKEDNGGVFQITRTLKPADIDRIKSKIKSQMIKDILSFNYHKKFQPSKLTYSLRNSRYRSIIALPIHVQDRQIGYIVLLNEMSDAFNSEMVNIITTFVNQASISIENLELIKESLENERYKEQLKIAKNVQKSLLPHQLHLSTCFEIEAYSMTGDEVGGDYYDILKTEENKYSLIIGDVSGKGMSAAFQMAQMKGIFHSLASQGLSPKDFNIKANMALGNCLDKSSFITATIFNINTQKQFIEYSRAGHCPTLMFCTEEERTNYLNCDGMGLGIVRNSSYSKYVHGSTLNYKAGDTMLLYTDGITEAKNADGKQFGVDRLKNSFGTHVQKTPVGIKEGIKEDLADFTGEIEIDDDYTFVVVKFKN